MSSAAACLPKVAATLKATTGWVSRLGAKVPTCWRGGALRERGKRVFFTGRDHARKLEALRRGGSICHYQPGGSRENIAGLRDITPAFAEEPAFALAGKW